MHILIDATNTGLCIQQISLHATVKFNKHLFQERPDYTDRKLAEIKTDLENLLKKYFEDHNFIGDAEMLSNRAYNLLMQDSA